MHPSHRGLHMQFSVFKLFAQLIPTPRYQVTVTANKYFKTQFLKTIDIDYDSEIYGSAGWFSCSGPGPADLSWLAHGSVLVEPGQLEPGWSWVPHSRVWLLVKVSGATESYIIIQQPSPITHMAVSGFSEGEWSCTKPLKA